MLSILKGSQFYLLRIKYLKKDIQEADNGGYLQEGT